MTGASIDVQRPPRGWSHLTGPGLHLLVALTEPDARHAAARAAATGGDLDDVLDALTAQGLRRTPGFVGVAGTTRPRVVTHGDGYAVLTSSRGTLEVRAQHGRVWSDLVAEDDVQTVALRVSVTVAAAPPAPQVPASPAVVEQAPRVLPAPPVGPVVPPVPAAKPVVPPVLAAKPVVPPMSPVPAAKPVSPVSPVSPVPPVSAVSAVSAMPPVPLVPPASGPVISSVPWASPRTAPGARPARRPDDPDRTVDRASLRAALPAGQGSQISGPSVLAVLCPSGHPNPPHRATCRVCGGDVPAQEPFPTARPALGVLRLSTGDVVTLDRGVLLGRSPKAPPDLPPDRQPHVVRVASPQRDISRNHLQVVLEGWQVLVRDLDTTNGTTVTPPGGAPVRLRAGEAHVIEAGTLVSLADEVTFVLEVSP